MDRPIQILLAEDNPACIRRIQRYIDKMNPLEVHLDVVGSHHQMLGKLDRSSFDLLLVDSRLSGSQGLEGLRALPASKNTPPLIVLAEEGDEEWMLGLSEIADVYVHKKDLSPASLQEHIREVLERSSS